MAEKLDFYIPAIRLKQREKTNQAIYFGKISAVDLVARPGERFKIDYYKRIPKEKDTGYQRLLQEGAVNKLKNFILKETSFPLLPTAILVNSRIPLDFKETTRDIGTLHITDTLYIIDGQHRFEAWRSMMDSPTLFEDWGNYEFPVILLSNFEELQEIEQFFVINSRQKKIKTDLAQRHLLMLAQREETSGLIPESSRWQLHATKIVDILNEQLDCIWKGKIVVPSDDSDLRRAKIISQSSFVSSLKPFFVGKLAVFDISKKPPTGDKLEEWAKLLAKFWGNVAKIYPPAIENPHDYTLMKTVGVYSLHLFLQKELSRIDSPTKDETLIEVDKLLSRAASGDFGLSFWRSRVPEYMREEGRYAGGYSSAAGHNRIAAGIIMGKLI